ncbi:ABC transporter substrate-binding protein [Companilactobacillus allii]|uniref:Nitrate ABC transporter substrate-binding protein n=1 Tax=Companilactobacillus allii TaxID=1847728 RepID=A0A1P8Q015_9LACO|nr:ABC transporter substrate-binding protein [Companilactobacillus allii]APX71151.1 nitrate ABC transporter substrate-binding protein [Companilactobacillus allii]USQ68232.1 ABC transporter substrate-binding protein [Companilactobacillus allii]
MKNRIKLLIILSLGLFLILGGCTNKNKSIKNNLKKVTIVLDWTPNTNHTGLYVAQKKGYFKKQGLDVKIVQPSDGDASTIVASGKADFGISAQDTLAANFASKKPLPITAVAAILQHNTSGIMSRKDDNITHPKELEHKTYATWDSPIEKAMLKNVMEKDGGNYSDLKMIPNNIVDEPKALKEKQADAIWVFYGWGGISANLEKVPVNYFYFKDLNSTFDYYTPVIISNNKFLKDNPTIAKKFMKATTMGYEYAINHPKSAGNILVQQVPELDSKLVNASQKWISGQYKAEGSKFGYIEPRRWNNFYNWLDDSKLIDKRIPVNTGFTNKYLPE